MTDGVVIVPIVTGCAFTWCTAACGALCACVTSSVSISDLWWRAQSTSAIQKPISNIASRTNTSAFDASSWYTWAGGTWQYSSINDAVISNGTTVTSSVCQDIASIAWNTAAWCAWAACFACCITCLTCICALLIEISNIATVAFNGGSAVRRNSTIRAYTNICTHITSHSTWKIHTGVASKQSIRYESIAASRAGTIQKTIWRCALSTPTRCTMIAIAECHRAFRANNSPIDSRIIISCRAQVALSSDGIKRVASLAKKTSVRISIRASATWVVTWG